jgi:hypothetical protein
MSLASCMLLWAVRYPQWAVGKLSVSVNAIRHCVDLIAELQHQHQQQQQHTAEGVSTVRVP